FYKGDVSRNNQRKRRFFEHIFSIFRQWHIFRNCSVYRVLRGKAGIASTKKPDSLDKAFHRAKDKLKDGGYIGEWDGYIWLLDNPDN
ncbi:MAG: hypothetical protein KA099_06475, partial [Alphaproteobacteria bacterium]|nr:hypothetical protein [Alphaproteobacteria bacterium]